MSLLSNGLRTVLDKRRYKIQDLTISWSRANLRVFPWRKNFSPYRILIAEILLKRTTSSAVNRMYCDFISKYPYFDALLETSVVELESDLKSIGLHKSRAIELKSISKEIKEIYNNKIPANLDKLIGIKYIGGYTAGAVLTFGYDIPTAMIDSNLRRLITRLFNKYLEKQSDTIYYEIFQELLPREDYKIFILSLLDICGKICTYRSTNCIVCPISEVCDSSSADI